MDNTVGSLPWDLSRKGSVDRQRHLDKAKEQLKDKLPIILKELPLIDGESSDTVGIPVDYLNIPRFIFGDDDEDEGKGVAAGPGKAGDVMGRYRRKAPGEGAGEGGSDPGEHGLEVVMSLDELIALVFQLLELPRLSKTVRGLELSHEDVWTSRKRRGPLATLDRRETLRNAAGRSASAGVDLSILEDDLRFRDWEEKPLPSNNAVVVLVRDVSGSMDGVKTHLVRMLAFWVVKWLQVQYSHVKIEFWAHDTRAWRVETEKEFFSLTTSGGTACTPVYYAVAQRLDEAYPAAEYNRYVLHLTDGDCMDLALSVDMAQRLLAGVRWFGYAEVQSPGRTSMLFEKLGDALSSPPFARALVHDARDLAGAIKHLMEAT